MGVAYSELAQYSVDGCAFVNLKGLATHSGKRIHNQFLELTNTDV